MKNTITAIDVLCQIQETYSTSLSPQMLRQIEWVVAAHEATIQPEMPLSMDQFGGLVGLAREDAREKSVVYKATAISGETCYFGVRSAALAWARSGIVEEVKLRDFKVVASSAPDFTDDMIKAGLDAMGIMAPLSITRMREVVGAMLAAAPAAPEQQSTIPANIADAYAKYKEAAFAVLKELGEQFPQGATIRISDVQAKNIEAFNEFVAVMDAAIAAEKGTTE